MSWRRLRLLVAAVVLPACVQAPRVDEPALAALGRAIFFDADLSPSGAVSCASCHDPRHAYGPPDADAVRLGVRAAPSLRYLNTLPAFAQRGALDPIGGHTWDGRADSAHEQARQPMLSPEEMGGPAVHDVVARLRSAAYAPGLRAAFGSDIFDRPDAAFEAALFALEVFQRSPADFHPFSSRYDAMLRGQATLSPQEQRGLALFNDPAKGDCAACHPSAIGPDGSPPRFTTFAHVAIGVPRNTALKANADARFFDLGLCGPLRHDLADRAEYCGRFRTPGLRNVALRRSFFHNAAIGALDEAVRFHVLRDTEPARWYGSRARFDDLPARYHANVHSGAPFGGVPGGTPRLSEAEIADVVAFLGALTDADQGENAPSR